MAECFEHVDKAGLIRDGSQQSYQKLSGQFPSETRDTLNKPTLSLFRSSQLLYRPKLTERQRGSMLKVVVCSVGRYHPLSELALDTALARSSGSDSEWRGLQALVEVQRGTKKGTPSLCPH